MDFRYRGNDSVTQEIITIGMTTSKDPPGPPDNRIIQSSIPQD